MGRNIKPTAAARDTSSDVEARGVSSIFVPMFNPPRKGNHSARVGWITNANGCDIWQGANNGGYGQVWVGGRLCVVTRVRHEREIGPIPEGTELDHFFCDNGAGGCCNPRHCRPVTRRENTLRGNSFASAHAAKTHCPEGHPLSGENLYKHHVARGCRECLICHNVKSNRARQRARLKRKAA